MPATLYRLVVAIVSALIMSGCVKSFGEFVSNQVAN